LLESLNELTIVSVENKLTENVVYADFSRAFDTVSVHTKITVNMYE